MTGDDFTYGGEFMFECDEGYRLIGPVSVTCMESGLWDSEELPMCELIQCGVPPVQYGLALLTGKTFILRCERSSTCNLALRSRPSGVQVFVRFISIQ